MVFSAFGGMSVECSNFYNRLAEKIAHKRNICQSKAKAWLRTKLSFCVLRTANLCIRGSRSKNTQGLVEALKDVSIGIAMNDAMMEDGGDVEGVD